MIKKKVIRIISLDEFGKNIVIFGQFDFCEMQKIVDVAEGLHMVCLGFINLQEDTYFNYIQAKDIESELKILEENTKLSQDLLSTLFKAADLSVKSYAYIKIEGL